VIFIIKPAVTPIRSAVILVIFCHFFMNSSLILGLLASVMATFFVSDLLLKIPQDSFKKLLS